MAKYVLVPKDPQRNDVLKVDEEDGYGSVFHLGEFVLLIFNLTENNRGWKGTNFIFGSKKLEFFYSRGEYLKIPDEDETV